MQTNFVYPTFQTQKKTTSIYKKVIVLKIDCFSSETVDDRNFGFNDLSEIDDFIELQSNNGYFCVQVPMDAEGIICNL